MSDRFELETPEAISLSYETAGIGTRFLAAFIDALAIFGIGVLLAFGLLGLAVLAPWAQTLAEVLLFVLYLLLFFGYYIWYETIWSGQTPGKRGVDIRVLKTSGYPISFVDALIRNLIRIVDMLPALYGLALVVMFVNSQSRRLGDLAAGTIVVKERSQVSIDDLDSATASRPPYEQAARTAAEVGWNLSALTSRDRSVIRAYLERAPGLPVDARQRIGQEIADPVAERIGAHHRDEAVAFLTRVLELAENE